MYLRRYLFKLKHLRKTIQQLMADDDLIDVDDVVRLIVHNVITTLFFTLSSKVGITQICRGYRSDESIQLG